MYCTLTFAVVLQFMPQRCFAAMVRLPYRCIADAKSSADFLKGTALHVVQPHDLHIIGRILAQRLYENISNKNFLDFYFRNL